MPSDVLVLQQPPVPPPESNLIAGMAAPNPLVVIPDTSGPQPPGPQQEPTSWAYDINPASGSARATFNGEVTFTSGGAATAGVTTWNGRSGTVVMTAGDVSAAGGAPVASPTFTGVPAAPTASPGTSTTQLATTAFVSAAIAGQAIVASFNGRTGAVTLTTSDITTAGGAPAASPALTGTPTGPTATPGNASSQLATTQFVMNAVGAAVVSWNGRTGAVTLNLSDIQSAGGAPLNAPAFTGIPTAPTATAGTATGQLATTAFVTNAIQSATVGVSSFNTRTGAVTLTTADVSNVGGALLAGPAFTGVPTAPTASAGVNTTQIATTAYVMTAIGAMSPVVATFNGRSGTVTLTTADITTAGGAVLASPVFTGTPAAPTPTGGDNSTRIATTAFVTAAVAGQVTGVTAGTGLTGGGTSGSVSLALSTPVSVANGGTGATTAAGAAWVQKTGDSMSGLLTTTQLAINPASGPAQLSLSKPTGADQALIYGTRAGLSRWAIALGTATTDDFAIARYNDAGAFVDSPITISRASGNVSLTQNLYTSGTTDFGLQISAGNRYHLFAASHYWVQIGATNDISLFMYDAARITVNGSSGHFYALQQAFKPGGGPWTDSSDVRIKNVIGDYSRGLDAITALRPVRYTFLGNDTTAPPEREAAPYANSAHVWAAENAIEYTGLLAQEVESVLPELVTTHEGYINGQAVTDIRDLDTGPLIFALINAVKELTARVAALETRP